LDNYSAGIGAVHNVRRDLTRNQPSVITLGPPWRPRHLGLPAIGPVGDACGDAVHEIVEVERRKLLSPGPEVYHVAVAQAKDGDAQLRRFSA